MARRIWKDRIVERPRTFQFQNNPDGTVTLIPRPGAIVQEGTPVNAANLNGLEEDLTSHLADSTKHITQTERNVWNNKQDALPVENRRKITYGTGNPSGGADGDIYFQYE